MISATLRRTRTGDTGTFGTLEIAGRAGLFRTAELPDRGNAKDISSIPAGRYVCKWHESPKFGWVYEVKNVPGGRTDVLIHAGNWAGDKSKGLKCDVKGCIALGLGFSENLNGQPGVTGSRDAIDEFHKLTNKVDLDLVIIDEYLEAGAPAPATSA